ncbi:MAG: ATP-grasp domain-containing protein, partial [Cellvibrionaceae bacterium]
MAVKGRSTLAREGRTKNIFVFGYDEQHEKDLRALPDAGRFRFHPLLHSGELVYQEDFHINATLERARTILKEFDGPIHGIICHWDFPVNPMAAILAEEFGLRYPSLTSILKCSHKYWSRVEQQNAVPEATPRFCAIDPFDDDPASQVTLDYPFWVKPIAGYNSLLGFRIDNAGDFTRAIEAAREKIGRIGDEFNTFLERIHVPTELGGVDGNYLIAEELIGGHEFAPEGYIQNGECHIHGMFDMVRAENGKSFQRYEYPSRAPRDVHKRAGAIVAKVMQQMEFDNGCFNIEFFWDQDRDRLSIIEVNSRMSQSHSYQFEQVDGMSNHEVAVHVALGDKPLFKHGAGPFKHAAKFLLRRYDLRDGIATRVPAAADVARLHREQPESRVSLNVH